MAKCVCVCVNIYASVSVCVHMYLKGHSMESGPPLIIYKNIEN